MNRTPINTDKKGFTWIIFAVIRSTLNSEAIIPEATGRNMGLHSKGKLFSFCSPNFRLVYPPLVWVYQPPPKADKSGGSFFSIDNTVRCYNFEGLK